MGVPSFYRWLAEKYPKIVVNAVEKSLDDEENSCLPNPNGIEFDNLYLDMNGIIHPCFHPENDDVNSPVTYDEVYKNLFEYIDRLMNIVRPRKLLYMAIDGVAPRAKMNQQRTRRFRNAQEHETLVEMFCREDSELSDSNVITPGTQFMSELSKQLQSYICVRISKNPAWKNLKVFLSDANAPGEGEHKIMSFIRSQRTCSGYNPNTTHVLYGLDADLIMLALATHEIHFSILRENVLVEYNQRATNTSVSALPGNFEAKVCELSQELKHTAEKSSSLEISTVSKLKSLVKKPYQFLHVWMLREYLNLDLRMMNLPETFELDIERLIDDFIFICFFAGNDFLPHMPTLEIHEGAMDLLIHVYKEEFKNLGGYLVNVQKVNDKKGSYIKLKRVEKFILAVGVYEDRIFKKRSAIRESKLRRILSDNHDTGDNGEEELFPVISTCNKKGTATGSNAAFSCSSSHDQDVQIVENTKMLKEQLKIYTRATSDVFKDGLVTQIRFFPYHYGPFASDLKGLSSTKVVFQKGSPFKPFDQLMAVLPPMSAHALPASYQLLMTDHESTIIDFYPDDFKIDTDGKRFLWQGICKLPFINEEHLLSATKKIEKELNEEEAKRNGVDVDLLFVHSSESFASIISTFNDKGVIDQHTSIKIDTGLRCVYFDSPCLSVNIPRLLEGTTIPETVVSESDIDVTQLWHGNQGYPSRNRYSQFRGATRGTCSGVIIRGAGNGWSPRGRGKYPNHCLDNQSNPRNYGHGNGNSGYYQPRWTGGSAEYPTRANTTNSRVMSGMTNSGSSTYGHANGRGAGAHGNGNSGYYRPTWTGSADGHVWSLKTRLDSNTNNHAYGWGGYYRPRWTGPGNGNFRSANTESGSSSNQTMWQRGGRHRNAPRDSNNGRW
nr:5'-3' exoribonuclease 3-like [Tanacetum cinerariifolium]